MLIYFLTFGFSVLLLALADGEQAKKGKAGFSRPGANEIILVIFAVALPCFLAAIRDVGVGTDTKGYGIWIFQLASDSDGLFSFMDAALQGDRRMEPLFALEAFVSAAIAPESISLFFFVIQASIVVPVYFGVRILSQGRRTWFSMLLFYLVFYPFSLNAMRQMAAAGFLFLGTILLIKEDKKVAWWVCLLVAVGFHRTALVGVLLYAVWCFVRRQGVQKLTLARIIAIVLLACVVVLLFADPVLGALSTFSSVYATYYKGRATWGNRVFIAPFFFYGLLIILVSLRKRERMGNDGRMLWFLILVAAISMPVQLLSSVSEPIGRMMWYFFLFLIAIPAIELQKTKKNIQLDLNTLSVVSVAVLQFWWFYALNGGSEIIPFTSSILGL